MSGGLFGTIACRELWGSWRWGREIRDGALLAVGSDVCGSEPRAPYDAADYPSSTPVTYFHGPFDPTTTTAQAQHHYETRQPCSQIASSMESPSSFGRARIERAAVATERR